MEDSRVMRSLFHFHKVILIISDGLTKEFCIAAYLFSKEVIRLGQKSGWLFVALYLKQCSSSLQMAITTIGHLETLLPVPVSLNRSGLPRIIPAFHRQCISCRSDKSYMVVRMYLSFFSLSKLITLSQRIDNNTFLSIISPCRDVERAYSFVTSFKEKMVTLVRRYVPAISTIPLEQGMRWMPT